MPIPRMFSSQAIASRKILNQKWYVRVVNRALHTFLTRLQGVIELTSFLPYTGERIGAYVGIDRRPDIQLQGVGMWSRRPGAVGR